jgi:hypothetical protein
MYIYMIINMFLYVSTKVPNSSLLLAKQLDQYFVGSQWHPTPSWLRFGEARLKMAGPKGIFEISKQHKLGFEWQKW